MTFKQYIDNPLGKSNAVFSQREMFKTLYTEKFNKILLREAGKINYSCLVNSKKSEYYCHIKIPSEVVPKFYYDVIVQFYTKDNSLKESQSLKDYDVRFFSNDASFVFTYLHVFRDNDMFIQDLSSKAPKQALKQKPVEKNPYNLIGYVKSLYFAYLFMQDKNLLTKFNYDMNGIPFNKNTILANTTHADEKIEARQKAEQDMKIKEKKAKATKSSSVSKNNTSHNVPSSNIKNTRTTSNTRRTSKVKSTLKTKVK